MILFNISVLLYSSDILAIFRPLHHLNKNKTAPTSNEIKPNIEDLIRDVLSAVNPTSHEKAFKRLTEAVQLTGNRIFNPVKNSVFENIIEKIESKANSPSFTEEHISSNLMIAHMVSIISMKFFSKNYQFDFEKDKCAIEKIFKCDVTFWEFFLSLLREDIGHEFKDFLKDRKTSLKLAGELINRGAILFSKPAQSFLSQISFSKENIAFIKAYIGSRYSTIFNSFLSVLSKECLIDRNNLNSKEFLIDKNYLIDKKNDLIKKECLISKKDDLINKAFEMTDKSTCIVEIFKPLQKLAFNRELFSFFRSSNVRIFYPLVEFIESAEINKSCEGFLNIFLLEYFHLASAKTEAQKRGNIENGQGVEYEPRKLTLEKFMQNQKYQLRTSSFNSNVSTN